MFTTAKIWGWPECPSMEEWIRKMWCIYAMEYSSAIKKNETLPSATTWMDLEGVVLNGVSQRKTNAL